MKILLDIDGVMIPAKSWQTYQMGSDGFGLFSKFAIEGLNTIIQSLPNIEIILTTSHKHSYSLNEWNSIFTSRGIIKTKINRLKTNSLNTPRIEEIKKWYLNNPNELFIIIDDDKGLNNLDSNFKEDYLILTKATIGLNKTNAIEAVNKIKNLEETIES